MGRGRAPGGSAKVCPCQPSQLYAQCCGRWHGGAPAPSALALMRSRYAAFVLHNEAYLLATWHANTRPTSIPFDPHQQWLGLTVVSANGTGAERAEVEFIARYRIGGGSAARLHELSRFLREAGCWYYLEGDVRPAALKQM